ncbi:hypothetical protein [Glycomyces sp. NPDC021274]|uniref:hypothetical protein n=1 Tax=Glycomyces sp. NPDC021274 TaxID=3155120 RepID=UPI003402FECD
MNVETTHEALAAKTIAELRAYAADQGISLPTKGRKADLIALTLDLLSMKAQPEPEPVEEEKAPTTTITLDCGHPFAVSHLDVLPGNVKGYLAKAKKSADCPRCPAAVAEPEGEVSEAPEPIEEAPAPAPTKAQKSSAPRKPKAAKASKPTPTAPKAKKSAKPKKALKKEPTGWGFSSKEGGHADSSKALIRAKTPDAKAAVAAELIEATGWTAKVVETSEEHAVLQATYGDALIVIRWQPLDAKKLDIRHYKTPDHKGCGLLNVSAALKACKATTDQAAPELAHAA